jgi:glycosyltransferase involved in cell wall biosynthesis
MSAVPRVSVLLPVRDGERHLREAVESILAQTFDDLEVVALDDGSGDGTPAILADLASRDARVRVERRARKGLTTALNDAARVAVGSYLARMDADDVAAPDRLERQVVFLDENPKVAVVGGAYEVIDDDGRVTRAVRFPTGDDAIRRTMRRRNCILHSTVMMRADAFSEAGGYRLDQAEDYDLWLRIGRRSRLANLPDVVLRYRRHAEQYSVEQIELQTLGALIARRAAEIRRRGGDDGLEGRVDREVAHRLGIDDGAIDRQIRRDAIRLASRLRANGDREGATALLRATNVGPLARVAATALARLY